MNLSPAAAARYTRDPLSAREAQRAAEYIAWAPVIFQVSRLMLKHGLLDMLRDSEQQAVAGLTVAELAGRAGLSLYAVKILTEAALSAGLLTIDTATDRLRLSKTGWFFLTDPATRVNTAFCHDVCYRGLFHLDEALTTGTPAGLKELGPWPTIYEGLSQLDKDVQKSWFDFDHFYSDHSFDEALALVLAAKPRRIMDVGGNTGRFALRCTEADADVEVTIVDLPGQIGMMTKNVQGQPNADRIHGHATDLLAPDAKLPAGEWDAIWMSQFLDCFSEEQIVGILRRAAAAMSPHTILYIMETFWDRQRFEPAALCLTMTSVYFTVMANGNSKMYHSDDMARLIDRAGLHIVATHDHLGQGHTVLELRINSR